MAADLVSESRQAEAQRQKTHGVELQAMQAAEAERAKAASMETMAVDAERRNQLLMQEARTAVTGMQQDEARVAEKLAAAERKSKDVEERAEQLFVVEQRKLAQKGQHI